SCSRDSDVNFAAREALLRPRVRRHRGRPPALRAPSRRARHPDAHAEPDVSSAHAPRPPRTRARVRRDSSRLCERHRPSLRGPARVSLLPSGGATALDAGVNDGGKDAAKRKDASEEEEPDASLPPEGSPCSQTSPQETACGKCGTKSRACLDDGSGTKKWAAW